MDDFDGLSDFKWECKYHIVFIQKYRRKALWAVAIASGRSVPQTGAAQDRLFVAFDLFTLIHENSSSVVNQAVKFLIQFRYDR